MEACKVLKWWDCENDILYLFLVNHGTTINFHSLELLRIWFHGLLLRCIGLGSSLVPFCRNLCPYFLILAIVCMYSHPRSQNLVHFMFFFFCRLCMALCAFYVYKKCLLQLSLIYLTFDQVCHKNQDLHLVTSKLCIVGMN